MLRSAGRQVVFVGWIYAASNGSVVERGAVIYFTDGLFMIQIIPNWHPVFVHFSVALLATSVLFYLTAFLSGRWGGMFLSVARVNLFTGFVITIATVIAGFLAYNSVQHDDPSHVAMTDHRNWALAATAVWAASAAWEAWRAWQGAERSLLVLIVLLIATALLSATGFKGGELVFRHGLGVLSLPNADHHQHPGGSSGGHSHDGDEHSTGGHPHGYSESDARRPNEVDGGALAQADQDIVTEEVKIPADERKTHLHRNSSGHTH